MEELVEQVQDIQSDVAAMKVCCDDMSTRLNDAKSQTSGLLRETTGLQNKSKQLELRSTVVDAFLKKFELTSAQLQVLVGGRGYERRSTVINKQFFETMSRVKEIHEDCKVLLRTSQQRAGLEIMESMAMHLESAYEQLYHWTQTQCRAMNVDAPETGSNLCKALTELQNRPILLQYCLDEYSIARRNAIVRCFIDALTREGNSGRPIELHSHDPVRYCSDMLSWLHQAIASENDHIASLLSEQDKDKSVAILSMVTEGACRPLHTRIEQVVVSSTVPPTVAYQLVSLLRYYAGVLESHLGTEAPLVRTVTELADLQSKMFYNTLTTQTSKLLDSMEAPLLDLTPTTKTNEVLSLLQSILSSRDMTVLASDTQDQDLKLILTSCIDPLIQHCNHSSLSMDSLDRSVYLVNTLYRIQTTISLYEFTESKVESLELQVESLLSSLVTEQQRLLLEAAGLTLLYKAVLKAENIDTQLKNGEGLLERVQQVITGPEKYQMSQFQLILSARLRDEADKKALSLFVDSYETIYNAMLAEKGQSLTLTVLPYTLKQVKQILSLC